MCSIQVPSVSEFDYTTRCMCMPQTGLAMTTPISSALTRALTFRHRWVTLLKCNNNRLDVNARSAHKNFHLALRSDECRVMDVKQRERLIFWTERGFETFLSFFFCRTCLTLNIFGVWGCKRWSCELCCGILRTYFADRNSRTVA